VSRGYRLTPEAQANVDDICAFIAEDSVDAAIRVRMPDVSSRSSHRETRAPRRP
jgi:hypothetical protein